VLQQFERDSQVMVFQHRVVVVHNSQLQPFPYKHSSVSSSLKRDCVSCQYGGLVVILPILIGCHELFKQNIHCASKMHQV